MASQIGILKTTLPQASREFALANLQLDSRQATQIRGHFDDLASRLSRYLTGEMVTFDDGLDLTKHSPFFRAALIACSMIPLGETRSYSWLASAVGRKGAYRSAGQAMARNPLPVLIPCHRVISSNGGLRGYAGGLEIKAKLLRLESSMSLD